MFNHEHTVQIAELYDNPLQGAGHEQSSQSYDPGTRRGRPGETEAYSPRKKIVKKNDKLYIFEKPITMPFQIC